MNRKARELGLVNTHFVTPHGLDNIEHYTTAYELALITDYALNNPKFAQIVSTKTKNILINGKQNQIYNTNELLGNLNGINGVKTGFTNNAGRCLVCSCQRSGMNLISVVLGADTKKFRTKDSIQIIEYAYENYEQINLKEKIVEYFDKWKKDYKPTIQKGEKQSLQVNLGDIPYQTYVVLKEREENVEIGIEAKDLLRAPVDRGECIGKLYVTFEDKEICSIDILTTEIVCKKDVWQYFAEIIAGLKCCSS